MAILRLFLVYVASLCQHIVSTPPEHTETSAVDKVHGSHPIINLKWSLRLHKLAIWSVPLGETIAYVLSLYPSSTNKLVNVLRSLFIPSKQSKTFGKLTTPFLVGVLLSVYSAWLRKRCYKTLGRLYTFEHTTRQDHKLVTTGPYAFVRHPGYIAIAPSPIASVLYALSDGSWLRDCGVFEKYAIVRFSFAAYILSLSSVVIGLLDRARKEDMTLKVKFGKEWEDYAKAVPYRFIPYIV